MIIESILQGFDVCLMEFLYLSSDLCNLENYTAYGPS